ncbi:MAG: DUF1360 domain-containing protein [Planctomycetaceae bacterium]|nr:DUF1360 domain-containing protein [Planctomycetaceae bacterium]
MVDFLIFCLATVGLTAILVHGEIFLPLRDWLEKHRSPEERQADSMDGGVKRHEIKRRHRTWCGFLFKLIICYQCCGFWSGLFCGIFLTGSRFFGIANWIDMFNAYSVGWEFMNPDIFVRVHLAAAFFWLMCGLVGSFLAMAYDYVFDLMIAKRDFYRHSIRVLPPEDDGHDETEQDEMTNLP